MKRCRKHTKGRSWVRALEERRISRRRGSGIPSLERQLNITKLEKQKARNEARGMLSPPLTSEHYFLTSNRNACRSSVGSSELSVRRCDGRNGKCELKLQLCERIWSRS
ncbi:hypothetical protein FHG68_14945 [Leptospira weilii]|nr:hypothetical protein FHG67_07305 [Leptospira weilii]QDK27821.1 hypothetical protein FHG68_14945 [Leptospira weilii]